MSRTTGPIIATAAITVGNSVLINGEDINWRIPISAAIAAAMLSFAERANEQIAVGLAWIALVTVVFVRVSPGEPAPVENFLRWWNG